MRSQRIMYPEYLRSLFTDTASSDHRNFKTNVRSYNSAPSFASMGANVEQFTRGVYFFKVHGQVYHNTYNINPLENTSRRYSQLYVVDTNDATDMRSRNPANEKCDRAILHNLDRTIREVNLYAEIFRNLVEVERSAVREGNTLMDLNIVTNKNIHRDMNRYNVPTTGEIAMIFSDKNDKNLFERDSFRFFFRLR